METKYTSKFFSYSSHDLLVKLVEPNKTVLDIGCSKGFLGKKLKEKGCIITGIDSNKEDLIEARKYYDKTLLLDINKENISGKYDIIILGDVIEHLSEPERILKNIKKNLNENGYLLISVPNIVNIYARLKILFGNFDYGEKGIFDKTHLRFFTLKSFKSLINNSGYSIIRVEFSPIPIYLVFPNASEYLLKQINSLFNIITKLYPKLFAYQFIAKVK
jgi:2-polyprenyl-3-methyl-5-hydroxy-6-metoxy-1,4-benzoquinol methylase